MAQNRKKNLCTASFDGWQVVLTHIKINRLQNIALANKSFNFVNDALHLCVAPDIIGKK